MKFLLYPLLLLMLIGVSSAGAETPGQVRDAAQKAVEIRLQIQEAADDWAARESAMLDEIESLEREIIKTEKQTARQSSYIDTMKNKIDDLRKNKERALKLQEHLEPILEENYEKLDKVVKRDLPFFKQERKTHLNQVGKTMSDSDAGLDEKTRVFLKALLKEVQYGRETGVEEVELTIDSRRLRVRQIHIGRLGLFALSPDGRRAWKYDSDTGVFNSVNDYAVHLEKLAEAAGRAHTIELIPVPLGRMQED